MEDQILIQQLEMLLFSGRDPKVTPEELKKVFRYMKNLERCLADALRLANERKLAA